MKRTLLLSTLFILFFNLSVFPQTTFVTPIQVIDPNTGEEPYEIASGDLDDDGDIDLVMATYWYAGVGNPPIQDYIKWYENDGAGNFSAPQLVSSTITYVDGLTIADIDGQNGNDIVATSIYQDKLVYFPSDGIGGFGSEELVASLTSPTEVAAADINNDGNIDLSVVSYGDDKVVWYPGDGTGNFASEEVIESGTTNGPLNISIGDFDGDTDNDALIYYHTTGSLEIYYNQYVESGTMTVSWVKDLVTVDNSSTYLLVVDFADVNNDGNMDVIKSDGSSGEVIWYNKIKDGASTPHTISDNSIIVNPGTVAIADLDNDTFNDVILTDGGTQDDAIIWFKGANNASPSTMPTLIEDNNYINYDITIDDFDDDGDKDIAFLGNSNDIVGWYENEWDLLGISSTLIDNINIYPNPVKDKLNFKGNLSEPLKVSIYDTLGKNLLNKTIELNSDLDVSNLQSGLYVLKFEGYYDTYKLVKQ
ncbi:MAG TPA: T9SS type A sorting domain-containing protein [Flavobacteriaceae bacterium]|nr:T9SS type A sorting domain-containing protein [Flavobacteriaceae bacterium]